MPQSEFLKWVDFYKINPFDDMHRYYRPAALLATTMGGNAKNALEWLQPEVYAGDYAQSDINVFKAFGIKPPVKG